MVLTIYILIGIIATLVFIPYLPAEHWVVRGQDYLKNLYLSINIVLIVLSICFLPYDLTTLGFGILLLLSTLYILQKFYPLTPLYPIDLPSAEKVIPERQFQIMVYNVYQKNDKYQNLVGLINQHKPEIVFLLETDSKWDNGISSVYKNYKHVIKEIRDDTYGLIMLSNIEVDDAEINHIVTEEIPSIKMQLKFLDKKIYVYGLHPKPPILGESLYSSKKDKEFKKIASRIKETSNEKAHLAIGDFNEVSWGRSFKKFWKKAGLHDPRRGRYFKATFPTYLPLRVPLDHILCSDDFELVSFDVLPDIGSDHYPILARVQLK